MPAARAFGVEYDALRAIAEWSYGSENLMVFCSFFTNFTEILLCSVGMNAFLSSENVSLLLAIQDAFSNL